MKCIKCGAYVYSSDKFCRSCGNTLNSNNCQYGDNIPNSKYDSTSCHEEQYNYSYEYSNKTEPKYNMNATHADQYNYNTNYSYDMNKYDYAYQPNDSGDDKYIKEYIGPNYNSIKNMKFSLPSLIFGPIYLMYRKVWNYALAAIIIQVAAIFLLNSDYSQVINLVINVFFGLKFQSIYMKQAEDKVEQIKQQGLDKSTTELLELCKKKGGTAIKNVVIAIFVSIIAYISLLFYLVGSGGFNLEEDRENIEPNYNTATKYTDSVNSLNYQLPIVFQKTYSTNTAKIYTRSEYNITCKFKVETKIPYAIYSTPDTFLDSITDPSSGTNMVKKNNYEWLYKQVQRTNFCESIYGYKYYDTLYILTLDNTNYYNCNTYYEQILNSLTFSEV